MSFENMFPTASCTKIKGLYIQVNDNNLQNQIQQNTTSVYMSIDISKYLQSYCTRHHYKSKFSIRDNNLTYKFDKPVL